MYTLRLKASLALRPKTPKGHQSTCRGSISGSHAGAPSFPDEPRKRLLQNLDCAVLVHELVHTKEPDPETDFDQDSGITSNISTVLGSKIGC